VWNIFEPTWNCPWLERFGGLGDGGKFVCGLRFLKPPCVIYSFGSAGDNSFERDVLQFSKCEVFTFDPTTKAPPIMPPNIFYKNYGLAEITGTKDQVGPVKTLQDIMKELNHSFVDLLKVDIELSEWKVFKQLIQDQYLPFGQLELEVHWWQISLEELIEFFEGMDQMEFRLFSRDPNLSCLLCQELSFISKTEAERLASLSDLWQHDDFSKPLLGPW